MSANNDSSRSGKSRKHLLWIIPAVLAVLVGGWFGVALAAENAASRCFAEASVQLFGAEVEPEELSYSLAGRELCIRGLLVKNPPGYSQMPAIRVGLIRAEVAPQDLLFKRVIRLKKLTFDDVAINVELKISVRRFEDSEINLHELKQFLSAFAPRKRSGSRHPGEPLRFRIDELRVEKGKVFLGNLEGYRSLLARRFGISLSERWTARSLDGYVQQDLGADKPLTADEVAAVIFERHWEDIKNYLEGIKNGLWEEVRTLMQEKVMLPLGPFRETAGQIWKKTEQTVKETFDETVKPAVDGLMKQMQGWFDRK